MKEKERIETSAFSNAALMNTGGTGSFRHTAPKHYLTADPGQIRVGNPISTRYDSLPKSVQSAEERLPTEGIPKPSSGAFMGIPGCNLVMPAI